MPDKHGVAADKVLPAKLAARANRSPVLGLLHHLQKAFKGGPGDLHAPQAIHNHGLIIKNMAHEYHILGFYIILKGEH